MTDGLQAVRAARTRDYDLILMDMMMPEMDGLAATAAIRTLSGRRGLVPIVGLTASATRYDEAMCIDAGMTVFTLKPITPEWLTLAMRAALATTARHAETTAEPATTTPLPAPLLDRAVLDQLRGDLGAGVLDEILLRFMHEAPTYLADITNAAAREFTSLRRHAHTVVGVARNIGLPRLGQVAAELEAAARDDQPVARPLEALAPVHAASLDALGAYRAEITQSVGGNRAVG